ncbi:glycosyltransferase family 2 protein [Flammeovirgaceae bacterium SG7u.111]|nr:glycosyltransferase family 2 protein [Flammeovirgaceae bacterium SG7u.132]WPO37528.1 glycosyltransferase family 2 protein [Flammeovirgaceae bacterium SG7u.111]
MNDLTITVVTVVYNDVKHIQKTMDSVLSQTYSNMEYIVIDGGSTDGTAEIIGSYSDKLSYWESEPDEGVYFAMNKAIEKVSGEYINFMNCGDWFASSSTVDEFFAQVKGRPDFVYGNHDVLLDTFTKHKKALPLDTMWRGMSFSHQAVFTKTSLMKQRPFDTAFKVAADFNFIFEKYKKGCSFQYVDVKVTCYQEGGLSRKHVIRGYEENWKTVKKWEDGIEIDRYYKKLIAIQRLIILIEKVLPKFVFNKLMQWKNKAKSA